MMMWVETERRAVGRRRMTDVRIIALCARLSIGWAASTPTIFPICGTGLRGGGVNPKTRCVVTNEMYRAKTKAGVIYFRTLS